ncbi:MAG: trypsin-like serine protease [Elusimicrobia bacterium]|nr:trypsin-like serine protease [Elusimicrobiota bacterium]
MKTLLKFLSFLILTSAISGAAFAQKNMDVRQYNNTYEIAINDGKSQFKCQAVRLSKDWFITAAHCVVPVCDAACTINARLSNAKDYELEISTKHSSASQAVYLHPKAKEEQVSYDIALIRFPPEKSDYLFKDKKIGYLVTKEEAFSKLNASQKTDFTQAMQGVNFPTVLSLKTQTPKVLRVSLGVASIWDYKTEILSSEDYVFFSPKHNYIYTSNFGIRQGISGSGVITSSGELAAIVSAVASTQRVITFSDGGSTNRNMAFSMFSTFDDSVLSFLKSHIPGLPVKQAGFNYFAVVPDEYRALTENVEAM